MSETPERPSDTPPEPESNETIEPTPTVTGEPSTEPMPAAADTPITGITETAPLGAESRARWRWLKNPRNRIAASVAAAAGGVAVVAGIFIGGVAVGAHTGEAGEHAGWERHSGTAETSQTSETSEMSAYPERASTAQVWIIPGVETAQAHGYIIAGPAGVYDVT